MADDDGAVDGHPIAAAAGIGAFFTALVITLFVLVAEVLEGLLTVGRGRKAIRHLLEFLPREVSVRRAGSVRAVSADELAVGDAILVAPGGRVPVDGTVLSGHSFVDELRITGVLLPIEKLQGTNVFAGSINQSGALEVRAERIGRDTSYGRIIEAVERAERSRAPVQRLADRLAGYVVYFALAAAVLTYLLTRDIVATISVIIVAGACGIAAGTPLAILGGIGRAARLGAIIKGGAHLETLGRVNTVVLDKTGTLTFGRPEVQAVMPAAGVAPGEVLDAAVTAELRSEHPLGKAIIAYATARGRIPVEPERFGYTPGRGITAVLAETPPSGSATEPTWRIAAWRSRPAQRWCPGLHPRCSWRATGVFSGRLPSPTRCVRRRSAQSKRSGGWECARCCSPATRVQWRKPSPASSVFARSRLACYPRTNSHALRPW